MDKFADANGNAITPEAAGMPGHWSDEMVVTVSFHEKDGTTDLVLEHTGLPLDQVDDCEEGWSSCLDKMAEAVETG